MSVDCFAEVHGIKGVQITAKEYSPNTANRNDNPKYSERTFVAQLTDTHCRLLAESHISGGIKNTLHFLMVIISCKIEVSEKITAEMK